MRMDDHFYTICRWICDEALKSAKIDLHGSNLPWPRDRFGMNISNLGAPL
jgi:hypothetical protein